MRLGAKICSSIVAVASLAFSCRPSQTSDTDAINNRPQSYDRFIAVLKLSNPALLTTARQVDGVTVVDDGLKAAILAEQTAVENALAQIAPEIQVLYRYQLVLNALAIVAPKA